MCKKSKTADYLPKYLKKHINEYHEKVATAINEEIATLITERKQLKSTLRRSNSQRTYNNIISSIHHKLKTRETSIKNRHKRNNRHNKHKRA